MAIRTQQGPSRVCVGDILVAQPLQGCHEMGNRAQQQVYRPSGFSRMKVNWHRAAVLAQRRPESLILLAPLKRSSRCSPK